MGNASSNFGPKVIRIDELPMADNMVLRDSSFFSRRNHSLPSPAEVRQKGTEVNGNDARSPRPPPIPFPELGLIVKYGSYITPAEAQCLWYFNRHMHGIVPTPELFGWCRDGGETFIYMQLVQGETLEEAWQSLSERDRRDVCEQLRSYVLAWRELRQESEPYYIGHIGRQEVGDIIFSYAGDANVGPFTDITAFHDFFARYSCRRHPEWNPRRDFPELVGLKDDRPVVFTHADLNMKNIMISRRKGSEVKVAAILDWHQSGWYPIDWEWLKAEWMCEPLDGGGRDTGWLSQVLDPPDAGYAYAWEYITSCL